MKLWKNTFKRGGVHLPEHKEATEKKAITNAPVPKKVYIPLHQHIGKPAKLVVNVGDEVQEGDLIASADGAFSANVHASIPGKVTALGETFLPNGIKSAYVEIEFNGNFKKWPLKNEDCLKFSKEELLERIKDAGIVGLGGATFPSHVKFSPPKEVETLLINGVECEPFLTVDDRVMQERVNELYKGLEILKKVLNPKQILVGIEDNKKEAIEKMNEASKDLFKVVPLKTQYPQGGEKQLIEAAIGVELPKGKLPFDIGVVVTNISTVYAVFEAIAYEKPLFEKVLTISGQIVKFPGNYKVKIGTLIEDLLTECQIFTKPEKVVIGGPMMGVAQYTLQTPIVKGTSGVLLFSKEEIKPKKEHPCIRCGRCMQVCPIGLFPTMMYRNIQVNRLDEVEKIGLHDCIECGACSYICPSKIPLVNYFKSAKINLKSQKSFYPNRIPTVRGWKYAEKDK